MLASLALSACAKKPSETYSSTSIPKPSQNTSTQAEPVTLEQALLKERGKPYDQSDYKTFVGGEDIINEYAEFDCNLDHGYSKTVNDFVVADGKLYQANFNSVLANGKNIQEVGTLPGKNIRYWRLTHDGEIGEIYLNDGSGYKVSNPPFTASLMDKAQHLNCNVKLRKLELLTAFYGDVRSISTSYVITEDYTMLPIAEVLTDGYGAYQKYDPCRFYWDYDQK